MILDEQQLIEFKELCRECFHKYDTNKDGAIEYRELKLLLIDVAKESGHDLPTDDDVQKVFHDADEDRDDVLSKDEFVELFKVIYIMKRRLYQQQ
jgi:Ca2+-binding EF-hand superfamily protein